MPLRLQLQGIKLDFFILLLKFALIKFHRYIIMELDKSKILTIICSYSKLNTQNITKIQRLYGNSYSDELTHCNHSILIVQRQVSEPTRKWTTCCYLRTLGKDLVLFNTLSPANFNVRCKKKATAMLDILRPRYNGR